MQLRGTGIELHKTRVPEQVLIPDKEKALVQFVADKLEVDPTILLELESSMETLEALEEEEQWIKTTDRPYLEIEAHVNEIADRRNVIFNSIKDLVTL